MLRLNRLTDYAIVTLVRLVEHSVGPDAPLSARQIAEMENLPEPMVKNALKSLHRAQFVASVRGARGGYRLAEDPKQITLIQIIEAIEGPMAITPCCDDSEDDSCMACRLAPGDRAGPSIQFVNDRVRSVLNDISLHQMVESIGSHQVAGVVLTVDSQLSGKASL